MRKRKSVRQQILDELTLRDFGTTELTPLLRGKARALARRLGCSPREALDQIAGSPRRAESGSDGQRPRVKAGRNSRKFIRAENSKTRDIAATRTRRDSYSNVERALVRVVLASRRGQEETNAPKRRKLHLMFGTGWKYSKSRRTPKRTNQGTNRRWYRDGHMTKGG